MIVKGSTGLIRFQWVKKVIGLLRSNMSRRLKKDQDLYGPEDGGYGMGWLLNCLIVCTSQKVLIGQLFIFEFQCNLVEAFFIEYYLIIF